MVAVKTTLITAFILAIAGQVLYHVTQKSIAPGTHPGVSLLMFYLLAVVLTLPLLIWFPLDEPIIGEIKKLNWAVYGVAVSIVLIEIGFLLAYRAGAELSSAAVLTSSVVTVSMLLVGVFVFRESVSAAKLGGIALCLAGIGLLTWKPEVAI